MAARTRRVTANLPVDLLEAARRVTARGVTETLIDGLERVRRSDALGKAEKLRARKLKLDPDLETSRERARR